MTAATPRVLRTHENGLGPHPIASRDCASARRWVAKVLRATDIEPADEEKLLEAIDVLRRLEERRQPCSTNTRPTF